MIKYYVADSFKNYEYDIKKAYQNTNGKLVVNAKEKCSKCNGKGIAISHVENGRPIPYLNDNGICYSCEGKGYKYKTIRLYTESEYQAMTRRNEQARAKKEAEMEARMEAEFAENKSKWLAENEFNEEGYTYVYFPADSYDVKETLKSNGFKFNPNLFWHRNNAEGYEDKVIKIAAVQIVEFSAWGKGLYLAAAKEYVVSQMEAARPQSTSEWVGVEKDKITNLECIYERTSGYDSRYGWTNIHRFNNNGNIITWFTTKSLSIEPGQVVILSATVKGHVTYNGEKQTNIIRAKVEINED